MRRPSSPGKRAVRPAFWPLFVYFFLLVSGFRAPVRMVGVATLLEPWSTRRNHSTGKCERGSWTHDNTANRRHAGARRHVRGPHPAPEASPTCSSRRRMRKTSARRCSSSSCVRRGRSKVPSTRTGASFRTTSNACKDLLRNAFSAHVGRARCGGGCACARDGGARLGASPGHVAAEELPRGHLPALLRRILRARDSGT